MRYLAQSHLCNEQKSTSVHFWKRHFDNFFPSMLFLVVTKALKAKAKELLRALSDAVLNWSL